MTKRIAIGGMIAAGFDLTGAYLLTVSHSGRAVFSIASLERVARDHSPAYPKDGRVVGIGPIEGASIPVTEMNYDTDELRFTSPDGKLQFEYYSGTLTIIDAAA